MNNNVDLTNQVREKYGDVARGVLEGRQSSCCDDQITCNIYDETQTEALPNQAVQASLGCGNPTALAELREGETVLDLGSGGGIDVFLAAQRVGPNGFVYGLDMTDEMLQLAEHNRQTAGVTNAQFLKGQIEAIPLEACSVDAIISNCVINLSIDKAAVLREAFRVLKPGGRLAVSDVVVEGTLQEAVRRDIEAFVGCIAGALEVGEYRRLLEAAGFVDIAIEPTRRYGMECTSVDGGVMAAFIRARKS